PRGRQGRPLPHRTPRPRFGTALLPARSRRLPHRGGSVHRPASRSPCRLTTSPRPFPCRAPTADRGTHDDHGECAVPEPDRAGRACRARPRGAAWVWEDGAPGALHGTVRFEWEALDSWFEEDEPVFVHPRSPYFRVDALRSSSNVRVELEGVAPAE